VPGYGALVACCTPRGTLLEIGDWAFRRFRYLPSRLLFDRKEGLEGRATSIRILDAMRIHRRCLQE